MPIMPSGEFDELPTNRVHTVLQNESAECGLACLAMVSTALGHEYSLTELRRRFTVSSKGMSLRGIMAVADAIALATRPVRLEISEIKSLKTPAVLHWDFNHFVVLERSRRNRVLVHDPAVGRRWIANDELSRSFTGIAIEFTPTPLFQKSVTVERVKINDLFDRVRGLIPSMVQMFILATLMQIFALLMPIANQLVVDEAITKGDIGLLKVLACGMLFLLITTSLIKVVQGLVGLYMGTQMSFQMRTNLLRHTLRLPVSWFEKRHVGDILSRFTSLQPIQDVLTNSLPTVILNTIITVIALAMMMLYAPKLALLEIASVIIALIIRTLGFPYIRRLTREMLQRDAKLQTTFLETIRGARTIKLFGQENDRISVWQNEQAKLINSQVALSKFNIWGGAGSSISSGIQQIIIWFLGAQMVIDGQLTLGMLFAFQAYTNQFSGGFGALSSQFFIFRTMKIHLERLADIIYSDEEQGLNSYLPGPTHLNGSIQLVGVRFRYGDQEPMVVDDVSYTINAGEFVCFRGPSGYGKTTLLKIMLGFEEIVEGSVLIDGIPLHKFGVSKYRQRIGAVLQDDQLFSGTIGDNISFFAPDAAQNDIEEAAKAACIHSAIISLPMQYQTLAGDLGSSLSGGQRQRVLLARALYRKPSILFLDEGTANLDPVSEQDVMDTIRSLDITRVVVAHRPQAAEGASRIFVVANGGVSEMAGDFAGD